MKQQVWSEDYKIASYLVNLRGQAGLYAILNLIQDVGWVHAFHMGARLSANQGWVFTRQKLEMKEWPAWNQTLTIRTWLRPPQEPFLLRDYELFIGEKKIGECTSTFAVMDLETRRLAKLDWSSFADIWRKDEHLSHFPGKIGLSRNSQELAKFEVRNSDIDMNHHVNNTKYAQWVLDSLPLFLLRTGVDLHAYEVNFLAEAKAGDTISVQRQLNEQSEDAELQARFQGVRPSDSKTVFTAQLSYSARASSQG